MFYLFTSLYPLMSVLVFLVPFSPVVRLIGGPRDRHLPSPDIVLSAQRPPRDWHLPSPDLVLSAPVAPRRLQMAPRRPPDASRRLQPSPRPLKWCLRHLPSSENEVPSRPRGSQNTNLVNHLGHKYLLCFLQNIHPQITQKKKATTSGRRFSPPNHDTGPTYLKIRSQKVVKIHPKNIKNYNLDPEGVLCGATGLPRSPKWCSRVPKGAKK